MRVSSEVGSVPPPEAWPAFPSAHPGQSTVPLPGHPAAPVPPPGISERAPIHLPGWALLPASLWKPSPTSVTHLVSRPDCPWNTAGGQHASLLFPSPCAPEQEPHEGPTGLFLPFPLLPSTEQRRTKNRVMSEGFRQMGADLGCSD
ncbi:hypothetical protein HJG60_009385 [Phyllostomus discolor]|uniref:Uncharacterized protein n=1 Tax=Phyllostomus discolor TaxID=89673 RepID=A0A833YKP5_9CHIR|nr:hypothetical protein HJG60_009385 [Phyllostomus discolor]